MRTLMMVSAIIRRFETTKDEYNNEQRGTPVDKNVKCWIGPRSPGIDAEDEVDRNQSRSRYNIFFYGNVAVNSTDQIIISAAYSDTGEEMTLEVIGEPMKYRDRQGKVKHLELVAEEVYG